MKQSKNENVQVDKAAVSGQPVATPPETVSGLPELFADGIKDMYWAENHLVKSLPKMISAAGSAKLQKALTDHWELTQEHAARLEEALEILGLKVQAKKCDAMEGLVMAGEHIIENTVAGSEARDTGLIMSALKVENFETTAYNGLIQLAGKLGQTEVAALLAKNLADEVEASEMLTVMSETTDVAA